VVHYKDCPEPRGRLWVIPQLLEGFQVGVEIVGDPEGLQYLADSLAYLARFDQEALGQPPGTHAHLHFFPRRPHSDWGELGTHSCPVTVCRADASVTGQISGNLQRAEEFADSLTADTTSPREWIGYAEGALSLAQNASRGPAKVRRNAAALAAHAIYCALMAGLRARDITVPEIPEYSQSGLLWFVPEDLVLPLNKEALHELLYYDDLARPQRAGIPLPKKKEIAAALDGAEKLIEWAAKSIGGPRGADPTHP
jgi:hypothetical protein